MSFDLSDLMADAGTMEDGVWVDFYGDSRLKIASADSPKYNSYLARLARQNKIRLDDENPKYFDTIQSITATAKAKHILLDWENIKINGKKTPYSWEIGKEALLNSPKLREFVDDYSQDFRNFKKELEEEVKE